MAPVRRFDEDRYEEDYQTYYSCIEDWMYFKKYEMSSTYQLCCPDDYLEQRRMFGSKRKEIAGSNDSSSSESDKGIFKKLLKKSG